MADVTVAELADAVGAPVERLLKQMQDAGLSQNSANECVTDHDKQVLLAFLKESHGASSSSPEKVALKRRGVTGSGLSNAATSSKPERLSPEEEAEILAEEIPKVFISYSYDSKEHETWVEQLAKMLRSDGIEAILDKWYLHPGDPITQFMEQGIRDANFVLIICTEKYKEKSDARVGGVGYEESIISSDMLSNSNYRKYIPILKSKSYSGSVPIALHSKKYIDLTSEDTFSPSYRDLLLTLYGRRPEAPPIGKAPDYVRS
ncbi:TIR domain-containing protein [Simiduia curdlanivorans]|uniref:Translation initiation factor IF-2 N-terminal domain-containing protein n=1 Tax=Simiduia curdlanivorans TaxID=1492769 RepID=A0ABV8V702_9GAMM|nr:translation initiation factor IF-2 N-terminal domain-containing protein [Simiduia curdlanivorans]MDN3638624.1 TIR domain-containing protein [Simiduia curdlanivorans]